MMRTALTQAFVGHAHVVTSLGQECDIVKQSCTLHLTIETPRGPVWFTMPNIVFPGGGDVVIIGQKTLREKLGIDVMAQLKASVLTSNWGGDGPEMEITAGAVGEPNAGAVLREAMAVTAFGPGGDPPGDVDDGVALTLLYQPPMMFQDSEVEVQDRVGALERRWSMTLLTMAYCRNVPRCCTISFFARTLIYSVGRCWATHLRAWSL